MTCLVRSRVFLPRLDCGRLSFRRVYHGRTLYNGNSRMTVSSFGYCFELQ